jgi:murein DD-endopeptidase MepM/ murein hydrolase activator NlpD
VFSLISMVPSSRLSRPAVTQPREPEEQWIVDLIPPGGSIFSTLEKNGIPLQEIATVTFRFGNFVDVTTIQPGDTLKLQLSPDGQKISKMMFIQEPTSRHIFTAQGDSLAYTLQQLPVQIRPRILEGKLKGTLDASLLALGLTHAEKQQINNGLETKINFASHARNGDDFKVFVEERIFEGRKISGTKIFYVSYTGELTGTHELFRYEDKEEGSVFTGLYTTDGKSSYNNSWGYPLGSVHVVSSFGRRIDPFWGCWAFHEGIDYRAGYGTPVYAVAIGTVVSAGYNGGWGNQVKIRHSSGMVSQYAHLSSMSVRAGQKVSRGQVIGRVGSTGRSTGAHLHFGLISGGNYVNPSQLHMVGAEKLNAAQMEVFKQQMAAIRQRMGSLTQTPLAAQVRN